MTAAQSSQSPRLYNVGDEIPRHGTVISVGSTAYGVAVSGDDRLDHWVPFYGPRGVDTPAPVVGLVSFADGSRYGADMDADERWYALNDGWVS